MTKYHVVARDRSVLLDGELTLREIILELNNRGQVFSLRRTLQLYGLQYVEERSFTSKYKREFELGDNKSMWDIRLRELVKYKDSLLKVFRSGG